MNKIAIENESDDHRRVSGQQNQINGRIDITLSNLNEVGIDVNSNEVQADLTAIKNSEVQFVVHPNKVSDFERQALPEFFDKRENGKTLESYLAIRNAFIDYWEQNSLNHQKRIGFREVLKEVKHKRLGNVTAFSRVHKFLDSFGIINCNLPKYNSTASRVTQI